VAYADFVTAMMAFFLLMWLINMVPTEKKVKIAGYFKEFSVFDKGGAWDPRVSEGTAPGVTMKIIDTDTSSSSLPAPPSKDTASAEQALLNSLRKDIETRLGGVKDQVLVDTFDGGVRIQLVDKQGSSLFPLGGTQLSQDGKKVLQVVSENLRAAGDRLAVEGHTDALSYAGARYTNWELSTDRASAARKELEVNGINPDCLVRVAGYAASQPLVKDDPLDPRNRRISIMIFSNSPCKAMKPEANAGPATTLKPGEGTLPPPTLPPMTLPRVPLTRP
jgi:chemotaxis protein MotB